MTIFHCLRFGTPPTWRVRSPYLYPPGTGRPRYNPGHWVPVSSPPTTRIATVEVFDPAFTRATLRSPRHFQTRARAERKNSPDLSLRLTFLSQLTYSSSEVISACIQRVSSDFGFTRTVFLKFLQCFGIHCRRHLQDE
jgi:hypothetical protein